MTHFCSEYRACLFAEAVVKCSAACCANTLDLSKPFRMCFEILYSNLDVILLARDR
jgi:hypothetical protein